MDNWKEKLTEEQYRILREKGTEAPFSGKYIHTKDKGVYKCAACGNPLFKSDAKFETKISGLIGWPSFDQAIPGSIEFRPDESYGMKRTAVVCKRCGSHLGHIFEGNEEAVTGKHYCINSVCLELEKDPLADSTGSLRASSG
ncbi:MAG: peptide-methionine (R)-S-oxide reductase MsrB [Candidatus Colwellbacteria bacterium]